MSTKTMDSDEEITLAVEKMDCDEVCRSCMGKAVVLATGSN